MRSLKSAATRRRQIISGGGRADGTRPRKRYEAASGAKLFTMNSDMNVRIVNRLLNTASIGMSMLSIFTKGQPEKGVCMSIAIALLLASMVQMMLLRWRPETFGDRPTDQE
jgi:hypothetical protein